GPDDDSRRAVDVHLYTGRDLDRRAGRESCGGRIRAGGNYADWLAIPDPPVRGRLVGGHGRVEVGGREVLDRAELRIDKLILAALVAVDVIDSNPDDLSRGRVRDVERYLLAHR